MYVIDRRRAGPVPQFHSPWGSEMIRLWAVFLWLVIPAAPALTQADNAPAPPVAGERAFRDAMALARDGRTGDAIRSLERLVRADPNNPVLYNNLAALHAGRGELQTARELLVRALETHPAYAQAYRNLTEIHAQLAATAYERALRGDEEQVRPASAAELALLTDLSVVGPTYGPAPDSEALIGLGVDADLASSGTGSIEEPVKQTTAAMDETDQGVVPDSRASVLSTVQAWSAAWSAQDIEAYLDFYGHHFTPAAGATKSQWEEQRRRRVGRPRFIEVVVREPEVRFSAQNRARVAFVQRYRSDTLDSEVTKELWLSRAGGRWKIVREIVKQ